MSNHKPEEITMQPSQANNAIAQLQSSEVIEFSLEQPVPQSSAIGVQADD